MNDIELLTTFGQRLTPQRLKVLVQLAEALGKKIDVSINKSSDLLNSSFVEDFSARLIAYHVTHQQKLTKKSFEYIFHGANLAAGRSSIIAESSVHAGADVTVDGVAFSLKTEGAKNISRTRLHISKLMEARWIRDCKSKHEFAAQAKANILKHLKTYERIVVLRAFEDKDKYEYHLVEIPKEIFLEIDNVTADDFSDRTKGGSSSAKITFKNESAFTLRLDGGVEKVTISRLNLSLCIFHGSWKISKQI